MTLFEDFQKLDIKTGKIVVVKDFPEARNPSYKLKINLGDEIGIKKSCAQLTKNYKKEELKGKLILCIVNFRPRQIGPTTSEVLSIGVQDKMGECILVEPERNVTIGSKLY